MKKYKSELAFFHDQGSGDYDPQTGGIIEAGSSRYKNWQKWQQREEKNDKIGRPERLEKHLEDIIRLVDDIKIDDDYKNNIEQIKLLKEKKAQAKALMLDVLNYVSEYLDTIKKMEEIKINSNYITANNIEDYKKGLETADQSRSLKHNALIDSINIVNRFISYNFGDLDQEEIEDWQERERAAKRPVLYANRVKLNSNIICPDNINLENREHITDWATQISESLVELKKQIKNPQTESGGR